MITANIHPRAWVTCLTLTFGWLVSALSLHAQTETGTIQGRVYNPASREYVRNAEVRLEGTNQIAYTENDGSFQLTNVPAGDATITVTYSGYNTVRDTFRVAAGQPAVREINLTSAAVADKDGVVKLQAFTVASEREGNAKAVMEQRRNMDIVTSVSSDIFGDVTDGNVGEFLKYLPGIDLDYVESEPRGPRLGGMDSQYVGVYFDGVRTASADANRGGGEASRATSFEGFAITSIESIDVSYTTSPDTDADSPAGVINMKTKRAFDRKGRHIGYNVSANFNAEEFTLRKVYGPDDRLNYKWRPNASLEYAESFLNNRLGILFGISRANSYTEQYIVSHGINRNRSPARGDERPLVIRQIDFKDGPKFILKDAMTFTADFRATRRLTLSLTGIYTYTEGEFHNRNFTWVAANDNANVNNGRHTVGGDGVLTVIATRAPSGSVNNVATVNNGGGSSSKLTYTRTFAPKFEYKLDRWLIDGAFTFSKSTNDYEALERGFSESEGGGVPSSWIATRPHDKSWEWTIRQTSGPDWFDIQNFRSTDARNGGTRVVNSGRRWITEIWNGQLNARWTLPFRALPTSVKFGGKWNEESRKNENLNAWWIWSYVGPGGNTVAQDPATGVFTNTAWGNWANLGLVSPHPFDLGTTNAMTIYNINGVQGMPPRINRNAVGDLFRARPELFVHTANVNDYYNSFIVNSRRIRQTVTAYYAQADTRVTQKLQLRTGVRYENTHNQFREWNPRFRDEVRAAGYPTNNAGRATTIEGLVYQYQSRGRTTRESEYHNYFPSVTARYRFTPNFEWQAGWNKAISRPPIDNLTGVWNIIEDATPQPRVDAPNANLQPEYAEKVQTRFAYYFSNRAPGQFSVSLSQNKIRNFRRTFDLSPEEFGVTDPEFSDYVFRTTINDVGQIRRFRNMDITYQQTLGFLPELLRGTSVNVTYSRSYANVRRARQAPHRLTSRLGYAYKRFNGSLGMVWRDNTPWDSRYGYYQREITQFDTSLNFRLTRHATLYVQGRNITGKPVIWNDTPIGGIEGRDSILRSIQEYGANWVFGVKGTF